MVFRILQNILSLLTGHVVSKLISLVSVIFLARRFGVEGFGTFGTVMAYLTLFAIIADNGLGTVTIRDVAQDYTRSNEYFSLMLALRGILTIGSYILLLLLGWLLKPPGFSLAFIAVCGLMLFPEALRKIGISFLTAYERMEIVAIMDVFSIIFRYSPFFLAVFLGKSLHVAFILLPFFWIGVATVWLFVSRRCCLRFRLVSLRKERLWGLVYESFPFGVFSILAIIYFKADILMLSKMQGTVAVGLYEGAYKFIEAAMFIPVSIVNVLLPVMSRSLTTGTSSYNKIYEHSIRIMGMGMLPIAIGVSFFAEDIILMVYRDSSYLPSASALALLIWALFFIFLNAPVGNVIATSKIDACLSSLCCRKYTPEYWVEPHLDSQIQFSGGEFYHAADRMYRVCYSTLVYQSRSQKRICDFAAFGKICRNRHPDEHALCFCACLFSFSSQCSHARRNVYRRTFSLSTL